MMNTPIEHLAAFIAKQTERSDERVQAASEQLTHEKSENYKLVLANTLLQEKVPPAAIIETLSWEDEPNEDGSFDVKLTDVWVGEEIVMNLDGYSAMGVGIYLGEGYATEWDEFMDEDRNILAAKVYEYAQERIDGAL